MSFVTRQAAHCDQCSHEWLTLGTPTHCAKCKSRKWNQVAVVGEPFLGPKVGDTVRVVKPVRFAPSESHTHNPSNCNVYKCGMCAALKA